MYRLYFYIKMTLTHCLSLSLVLILLLVIVAGAVQPESSGLGGGGFMTVRQSNGSVHVINFREKAPGEASEDMFNSNSTFSSKVSHLVYTINQKLHVHHHNNVGIESKSLASTCVVSVYVD